MPEMFATYMSSTRQCRWCMKIAPYIFYSRFPMLRHSAMSPLILVNSESDSDLLSANVGAKPDEVGRSGEARHRTSLELGFFLTNSEDEFLSATQVSRSFVN